MAILVSRLGTRSRETIERARFIRGSYLHGPSGSPTPDGQVLSSFLGYVRTGRDYLALASLPAGTPPVSFLFHRRTGRVTILAYAEGARFSRETFWPGSESSAPGTTSNSRTR